MGLQEAWEGQEACVLTPAKVKRGLRWTLLGQLQGTYAKGVYLAGTAKGEL